MNKKCLKVAGVAVVVSLLLAACKKGDNTKLEDTNQTVSDYMSTKEGSWWMYASADGTVFIRRATGVDSTMLDKVYNFYKSTDTASQYVTPEYFGQNGQYFLTLIDLDGGQENYIAAVVNKDNPQLGDEWSNTGSITYSAIPFSLLTEGTITGVNQTIVIGNNVFDSVVETTTQLKAKPVISPSYTNCGTAKMWFKRGVGIIKSDFDISVASLYSKQYKDSLIDYHIEE